MLSEQNPVTVEYFDDSARRVLRFAVSSESALLRLKKIFEGLDRPTRPR